MAENEMYPGTSMSNGSANNTANGMTNSTTNGMTNSTARNNDYGLTTPVAPEGGSPVYPDNERHIPTPPVAPEGGQPGISGKHYPRLPVFSFYPQFSFHSNLPVFSELSFHPDLWAGSLFKCFYQCRYR